MTKRLALRSFGALLIVAVAVALELTGGSGIGTVRDTERVVPLWILGAVTMVAYLPLLLRWRYPLAVFGWVWLFSLSGLLFPHFTPFVGLLIALHAIGSRLQLLPSLLTLLAACAPLTVDAINGAADRRNQETEFVLSVAGQWLLYALLAVVAWGIGRLSYLSAVRAQQQRTAAAADAIHAERISLARDLHDIVSHAVSAMLLQAAGAKAYVGRDDARVQSSLSVIESAGVQTMTELHRLLGLLRAVEGATSEGSSGHQPSVQDIRPLIELTQASGVDVEMVIDGTPRELDPSVSLAGHRVMQEALTNAVKHAGHGASVCIHLAWTVQHLRLTVRTASGEQLPDRPQVEGGGLGLLGLTERVALVGGRCEAGPVPGGFRVAVELPCVTNVARSQQRPSTDTTEWDPR